MTYLTESRTWLRVVVSSCFVRNRKRSKHISMAKKKSLAILRLPILDPIIFIGGRNDGCKFSGELMRLLFDRSLSAIEIGALYETAEITPVLDSPPLSPTRSLKKVQVPKEYKIELVANEPLVKDPDCN